MRVLSNYQWPEREFRRPDRLFGIERSQIVGFDVEWTKNYRVKGGSRPFCYSLVSIAVPSNPPAVLADVTTFFGYKSVYVDSSSEEQELIRAADHDLFRILESGMHIIAGHQLTTDLSVLRAAGEQAGSTDNVERLLQMWHSRQDGSPVTLVDTRYDSDQILDGKSRRLVDVCGELSLEVAQPELKGSMTKMHRTFLETGEERLQEKLTVLNLRHSLSTAIVALLVLNLAESAPLDVNDLLIEELWDQLPYVRDGELASAIAAARQVGR